MLFGWSWLREIWGFEGLDKKTGGRGKGTGVREEQATARANTEILASPE
jgi:hypothetical protein